MAPTTRPIRKLLCANRGEIAIRVFRAATELGIRTVAIFSHEDRVHLHRYKADEAYLVGRGKTPVGAYLDIDAIVALAAAHDVDAIHPGYGFLSEKSALARACAAAGIAFVGPSAEALDTFGDKTAARALAIASGVPVVPGSDGPVPDLPAARAFAAAHGFPLIVKAAMGGGGRGMRVVRSDDELDEAFTRAASEAKAAFGDGTVFLEKYIGAARHVEVQILGDRTGEVVHLFERDCSVQRRHQKVVEMAPALGLSDETRAGLHGDALRLARAVGYENAGTVEFLVDETGRHYFIEVNPRIQVEHTVTEEITGVDLVQAQIRIAGGATLHDLGLHQEAIVARGHAVQCRITTEDPRAQFRPDTGRIEAYRSASGMGIRLDGGSGYSGAVITPHYDSLLVKVTARGNTFEVARHKLLRALAEFRIRGVKTNIPFLQNVLTHPKFVAGDITTGFVDGTSELFDLPTRRNRAQRLLRFLAEVAVNGPTTPWATTNPPARIDPEIPDTREGARLSGWRDLLREKGPKAFAAAVRAHPGLLLTDTTWRDAHQSLLATRVRTIDLLAIAPATARVLAPAFSLEMWGGATFDVALRFLREDPWDRLERLRALVPNIPFQMLLRGANAVGYTNYPDNVVRRFVRLSAERGVDVFRIFDCLNYTENLKLGVDAVGEAGGVIEAALCYTGDVADPGRTKYSLQYYVDLAGKLVEMGTHVLAIKDMAGLLRPRAAMMLVEALRAAHPDVPIHVHTHDTAGTGVASMLAASAAGADIVDAAITAMAGVTSQPALGALVAALQGSERDTGLSIADLQPLGNYWEQARGLYAPFEAGNLSGSADVYLHEMPGGQLTNLQFQANALGLASRWPAIKRAYAAANRLLGDVIKVTPSSKVVGDLAQFMVQNDLDEAAVQAQADTLSFPSSVVEFFQGHLGQPYGGFPEPLRTKVLRGRPSFDGRPGAALPDLDFDALTAELRKLTSMPLRDVDVVSAALYPGVFRDYLAFRTQFADVSRLPTRAFFAPLPVGEELSVEIEQGKTLIVRMKAVGELGPDGQRDVFFELNGQPRSLRIPDKSATQTVKQRERAAPDDPAAVAAPMPGAVTELRAAVGDKVAAGAPLIVLSAMKMETVVAAPHPGVLRRFAVAVGDNLDAGDLLLILAPA
ncbi:pyruvate carboxylase [Nannocystis sp. RBIL2]|uniref:pyruvate carboxylase n=1 Tax=Nannocystis sp. RBIL2 TaxID=2996788 RepID=UPI0022714727|nr:pyruvate carboxylase [Nannocystis sp. RBIL2]MCY1068903.1 pyruvate carboxylase [Nannocystis sp. RBIL2]